MVKYAKIVVWLLKGGLVLIFPSPVSVCVLPLCVLFCFVFGSLCPPCVGFSALTFFFCVPVCANDWQAFCDELETMIQDQLKKGKTPTSLLALQQIADFMTTSMPSMYPAAPQGGMAALNMSKLRAECLCVCVCVCVTF